MLSHLVHEPPEKHEIFHVIMFRNLDGYHISNTQKGLVKFQYMSELFIYEKALFFFYKTIYIIFISTKFIKMIKISNQHKYIKTEFY